MREHARELLPRLQLARLQLVVDVLERDQRVGLAGEAEARRVGDELLGPLGGLDAEQAALAGAQRAQRLGDLGRAPRERVERARARHAQRAPRGEVEQRHRAIGAEGDERHADVPHHGLEVAGLLLALGTHAPEGVADRREGVGESVEERVAAGRRERGRDVVVADAAEKAGQVARRALGGT